MRGVWAGVFVAVGLLAACGKFGKDDGDTPADTDDGGTTPTGTSSSSGTSGGSDGATPSADAAPEAGPHSPVQSCAGAAFCDLFDRDTAPMYGWDSTSDDEDDALAIATDVFAQGTGSFRVDVQKNESTDHARLIKTIDFSAPPKKVVLEFSFRAPASFHPDKDTNHLNLGYLTFNGDLALVAAQDGVVALNVSDVNSDYLGPGKTEYVPNQFNDVKLTVDITDGKAEMALNGSTVQTFPIVLGHGQTSVQVVLGPSYSNTASAYTVYFDAVRVTTQ